MPPDSLRRSRVACLDGLRGIAIALVLLAHFTQSLVAAGTVARRGPLVLVHDYYGGLGVTLFFVLSGYLITRLLVRERVTSGSISLRHFYLRRVLRILPPLALFLVVLLVCKSVGLIAIPGRDFVSAGLFVSNYRLVDGAGQGPYLGHIWSLATEEQFYMFWPALLVFAGFRRTRRLALAVIALMPLIRIALYLMFPGSRFTIETRTQGCADRLMYGSFLALAEVTPRLENILQRGLKSTWVPLLASLHFLVVSPLLNSWFAGRYRLPIGISSEALAAAIVLAWVLRHPEAGLATWLESRALVTLGTLSYSLYLWQQPFLSLANRGFTSHAPLNLLLAFAAAMASYGIVERPLLALRRRYSAAAQGSRPLVENGLPTTAGGLSVAGPLTIPSYSARDAGEISTATFEPETAGP
jgi:peptidoglycan/LPS O-acetylase OafA/YrhL